MKRAEIVEEIDYDELVLNDMIATLSLTDKAGYEKKIQEWTDFSSEPSVLGKIAILKEILKEELVDNTVIKDSSVINPEVVIESTPLVTAGVVIESTSLDSEIKIRAQVEVKLANLSLENKAIYDQKVLGQAEYYEKMIDEINDTAKLGILNEIAQDDAMKLGGEEGTANTHLNWTYDV